jgi:uncharacterized protein
MTPNSGREDRLLKKQILILNRHIPKERKSLKELLEEKKPHVVGADGVRHRFKSEELKKVAQLIPEKKYHLLKLPIYIEIESSTSGSRISGKLESQIVCGVLGLEDCESEIYNEGEIYIYRPDLRILRRKLPTTTQYIFLVR